MKADHYLILVKHSLPEINQELPAREWRLSEEGRERANRLAERLSSYPFQIIYSSAEPKALETAQIISSRCAVALQVLADLHEHQRKSVPFLSKQGFEAAVREFFSQPDRRVFGSESANEAHERFSRAVNSTLAEHEKGTVVIVAHGTVISLFVSRLTGVSDLSLWEKLGLPSFVVLDRQTNQLIAQENIL